MPDWYTSIKNQTRMCLGIYMQTFENHSTCSLAILLAFYLHLGSGQLVPSLNHVLLIIWRVQIYRINVMFINLCYVFVACTSKTVQFTLHPHTSCKVFHALLCMIVHFLILSHLYDAWIVIGNTAVCGLLNLASCCIFEQLPSGDKYNKSLLLFK